MLSGTGSNVYVQKLCQVADPLAYGLVNEHPPVEEETIDRTGVQETSHPGRCAVETDGLSPVYDEYPGWRVKTFLDFIGEKG
jgi:hypothetical protein